MEPKNKDKFPGNIREVSRRSAGVPKRLVINLADAAVDREFGISGNLFYVWEAPDESVYIGIKVNESNQPLINYTVHTGLKTPFDALLITTPAGQAGNLVLIYGTESPDLLEIIDNRSTTVAGTTGILGELQGPTAPGDNIGATIGAAAAEIVVANATRHSIEISALSTNPGSVFLGFDNTITAGGAPGTWAVELQAGQTLIIDDYRGPIFAIRGGAACYVGIGEW